MHSDFELIQKHFANRDNITIIPISDVHLGASEHMQTEWINFINQVKSVPNCYVILGGDLVNNATKSCVSNIFVETMRPR